MVYTCGYRSPLGDILMAADENGLIGLWFEGQKYFADTLPDEHVSQETPVLTKAKGGWIYISPVMSLTLRHRFIPPAHHSDRRCGRFYQRSPMDRQLHMEK